MFFQRKKWHFFQEIVNKSRYLSIPGKFSKFTPCGFQEFVEVNESN